MSHLKTNVLAQYVTTPEAVTIDRYDEMLNVSPPENWKRLGGFPGEYFQLCEYYAGNVTSYFVKLDDSRCFTLPRLRMAQPSAGVRQNRRCRWHSSRLDVFG